MADPLGTLWQLLAGTPAQASPTPGFGSIAGPPSPGVTAPQTTPNTGGLLSSPLAQGALGAYFGYLARPRGLMANRWQGLGMAGLGGLDAYSQAAQLQQKLPLEQAQLQNQQTELGIKKSQAQQVADVAKQRKVMLDQFDQDPQMQKLDPMQRLVLRNGLMTGKMSLKDLGIEPITPYQKAELEIRKAGQTSQDQQREFERNIAQQRLGVEEKGLGLRAQEVGLRGQDMGLRSQELANDIQKQRQEAGLLPLKADEIKARIKAMQAGGKPKPVSAVDLDKQVLSEAKEAYKSRPWSDYRETFDQFLHNYRTQRLPELQKETASPAATPDTSKTAGLPPLPAGAKEWARGPSGELGYHDANGNFHPLGE